MAQKEPSTEPSISGLSSHEGVQNILSLLGGQKSGVTGPEINSDVAALLSGFLLTGLEKDSRTSLLDSYPCISNCSALQPPAINPEIKSCLDTNALKQDNFLSKLQSQLAAGLSVLAVTFEKQYEITKSNSTDETRKDLEKSCDPLKIFTDFFHALSLHRRYSILLFLDTSVKKVLETCPIDEFLFGKVFQEQLKSANEAQKLGSSIKKKVKASPVSSKFSTSAKKVTDPKPGPSKPLNFRRLPPNSRMKKEEGRTQSSRPHRGHRNY